MEDQRLEEAYYQANKNNPLLKRMEEQCCCRKDANMHTSNMGMSPKLPESASDPFGAFMFGLICGLLANGKDDQK